MRSLLDVDVKKRQFDLIKSCVIYSYSHLDFTQELFQAFFPETTVKMDGSEVNGVSVMGEKIKKTKEWIRRILELSTVVYNEPERELPPIDSVELPQKMAERFIGTVLKVLTCGRKLSDADYYFVSDVSVAMGLTPENVLKIIEQELYEIRKHFFDALVKDLSEEQCFHCAVLLYKAIQADSQIHPLEFKYIENINQLIKNDQSKLNEIRQSSQTVLPIVKFELDDELVVHLFEYMIEIVLCDQEFDARESKFVQETAKAFGLNKAELDNILQPIAATIMVKESLFPHSAETASCLASSKG